MSESNIPKIDCPRDKQQERWWKNLMYM